MDSDKAVLEYLDKHPDLLLRNPELLSKLQVPHLSGMGSVSLIERQVRVLRDKNQQLEKQINDLTETAQRNELLSDKMHRYSIGLMQSDTVRELLETSLQSLKGMLDIDAVAGEVHHVLGRLQPHLDLRKGRLEGAEPAHQPVGGERRADADGQEMLRLILAQPARRLGDLVEAGAEQGQRRLRRLGQDEIAAHATQQGNPEIRLQGPHLVADGRRRDVELARSLAEAQVARGRLEGAQRVQRREALAHAGF